MIMKKMSLLIAISIGISGLAWAAPPQGGASLSMEQRLARIERLVDSDALIDILNRLSQMESDLQVIRGQVEEQGHAIRGIKERQRELYLDVDRRLQGLQGASVNTNANNETLSPNSAGEMVGGAADSGVSDGLYNQEQEHYQNAFQLLKEGKYDQAGAALGKFLAAFPQSSYAANAQYWLGETHYVTRSFEQAQQEFNKVIDLYPNSAKVPDALLKISYIYFEKKDWEKTRTLLQRILQDHASSTAASLAEVKLRQLP